MPITTNGGVCYKDFMILFLDTIDTDSQPFTQQEQNSKCQIKHFKNNVLSHKPSLSLLLVCPYFGSNTCKMHRAFYVGGITLFSKFPL